MSIYGNKITVPDPGSGFVRVSSKGRMTAVYSIDGDTTEAKEIAKSFWFCDPVSHIEVETNAETTMDGGASFDVDVYIHPRLSFGSSEGFARRHALSGASAAKFCDRYNILRSTPVKPTL